MRKKLLSVFLVLAMTLALLPISVLAEEKDDQLKGTVKELTPTLTEQKEETMSDSADPAKTVPVITVKVKPSAEVPFSPRDDSVYRYRDGWWVGISIQAPAGVDLGDKANKDIVANDGLVHFRNNNDYSDRYWKNSKDGGSGTESDPYYMTGWNGPSETQLASGKTSYTVTWYFNWDGKDDTGITVAAENFKNSSAAGTPSEMKGVDQVVRFTFELTDGVKLLGKPQSDGPAWPIVVNFLVGEGVTAVPDQKVGLNGKVTKPDVPVREGYTFGGWYQEAACEHEFDFTVGVTKDATIYAKWTKVTTPEPEKFTVTFDSQDGSAVSSVEVVSGGKVTKPEDPTREGYTFGGWYKEANCETAWKFDEDTVTGPVTLYAKWTEKTSETKEYTITFNANGGSVTPTSVTTKEGKLAELPTPTRTGYTFDGWYTAASGGDQVTKDQEYTADTTLYAHWTSTSTTVPDQYYISVSSGIRHGDVYISRWYAEPGTEVTITVDPDSGYQVDWVEAERADGYSLYLDRNGRRYTFTMPASNVMVDARFVSYDSYYYTTFYLPEEPVESTFVPSAPPITWRPAAALWDVPAYSWAYTSAQWAYQNGYLDIAADGTFRLNDPVSHQQMWKIMARWLGGPVADERGVASWARQMGAAQGKPAASAMTRQNMVDYLYQCYFLMGGDVSVTGNLSGYQDSRLITSAPAQNAWLWAVNRGIVSGTAEGYLNPNGVVSRGEFATILMRLCQNVMR